MSKISNREKILYAGLGVVHQQGFGGASVRDIVSAAGVPQGSFTNHFASKEAFGLEILNLYYTNMKAVLAGSLLDERLSPMQRLKAWIGAVKDGIARKDVRIGCMFGNFSAEATNCDGPIRLRLTEIFWELKEAVAKTLAAAVAAGELPQDFDVADTAGFLISAMQGSILLSKAHRSVTPLEQFEKILFTKVLR